MTPSTKDQLDALIHRGSKKYALRDYDAAAELFAQACELYSASHETDSAALLFLYGRALFQLGVSKSDVLGGAKKEDGAEEAAAAAPEDDAAASTKKTKQDGEAKFQFAEDELKAQAQGDEDEQDEADGAEEEDQDGEQQSDLEVAWEILDTSRALFVTQIAQLADTETEKLTELEKGLADTYDVLGEVSLESENFEQAALDFAESLQLKKKNYEPLSSLISEAHFKLSLAYEFCVNDPAKPTVTGDDQGPSSSTDAVVRKNKERAVSEMQKAIAIVKEREASGDNTDKTLLKDLESRLTDLRNSIDNEETTNKQKSDALVGLTGLPAGAAGSSAGAAKAVAEEIAQTLGAAMDVSSLIRKGKKKKRPTAPVAEQPSKRKLEEEDAAAAEKKAKTE